MNTEKKDKDRRGERFSEENRYSPKENLKAAVVRIGKILIGTPEGLGGSTEEEKKQVIKRGAYICMFFVLGFLFEYASLPFGSYPFGIALIGSASSHCITIALGALASMAVFQMPVSHYFALAILLILRVLGRILLDKPNQKFKDDPLTFIKYELFSESIYLRMSAVSVAVFSVGLWSIISNNFRYYDLWGALLGMVIAPVAAYIFSLFFDSEAKSAKSVALAAFLCCAVYSLRLFDSMGMFLSVCVSQVIVLSMVRKLPPIYTLAMAASLGFICDIRYTPMFLLSASAYISVNVFAKAKESAAFFVSLAVSVLWGTVINGREALYTVFPAILAAAAVDNLIKAIVPGMNVADEFISARTRQALLTNSESERKLEKLSESFQNLSAAFKRLSDKLAKPGIFEIRKECDDVLEGFCNECKNSPICWGEDYNTTIGFLNDASTFLGSNGQIDESIVPKNLKDRCEAVDEIVKEINIKVKELYRDSLEKEKLTVFSSDYSALSQIITESISEKQSENAENRELTEKAIEALGKFKNDFHTISVWGKRKIRVFARLKSISENTVGMREFKRLMEECCKCSFANPILKIEGKSMTITLNMRPILTATAASARRSAGNLPLCGDSPSYFNGHDNYFYALISDGMGTGANAALASGICEVFLREMLEGGNRVDTSIKMLNAVIASKGDECSATIDIMELDLYSGNCTFIKSGAASSFILRDGSVYKLSARTMPLGILDEPDTDKQRVRLRAGDIIFLVSDGAAPMDNYENLINIIKCSSPGETPEQIANRIIENTAKYSKDDISCVAVKIEES